MTSEIWTNKKKERDDIYRGIRQNDLNSECENEQMKSIKTDEQVHSAAIEKKNEKRFYL